MKAPKGLIILMTACFLFVISLAYAQQPQDVYDLKLEGAKFPPVKFNHTKHTTDYKVDCKVCHHKEADPKVKAQKCTDCHDPAEVKDGSPKAMDAYHKTCIGCHKQQAEAGKAAPTKCNECHKKS